MKPHKKLLLALSGIALVLAACTEYQARDDDEDNGDDPDPDEQCTAGEVHCEGPNLLVCENGELTPVDCAANCEAQALQPRGCYDADSDGVDECVCAQGGQGGDGGGGTGGTGGGGSGGTGGADPCGGECSEQRYTACTCAASDPCGWAEDAYCDDACEVIVDDPFSDWQDCSCTYTGFSGRFDHRTIGPYYPGECDSHGDCCGFFQGYARCVFFDGEPAPLCVQTCTYAGDCSTGCCVPLDSGSGKICSPSSWCD